MMTGREKLNALMTEFDEMGYTPTTLCSDPEDTVRDWRACLTCAITQIEREARKQAVKEAFKDLKRTFDDFYTNNSILTGYGVKNYIAFLAQKYGVEIDE